MEVQEHKLNLAYKFVTLLMIKRQVNNKIQFFFFNIHTLH